MMFCAAIGLSDFLGIVFMGCRFIILVLDYADFIGLRCFGSPPGFLCALCWMVYVCCVSMSLIEDGPASGGWVCVINSVLDPLFPLP